MKELAAFFTAAAVIFSVQPVSASGCSGLLDSLGKQEDVYIGPKGSNITSFKLGTVQLINKEGHIGVEFNMNNNVPPITPLGVSHLQVRYLNDLNDVLYSKDWHKTETTSEWFFVSHQKSLTDETAKNFYAEVKEQIQRSTSEFFDCKIAPEHIELSPKEIADGLKVRTILVGPPGKVFHSDEYGNFKAENLGDRWVVKLAIKKNLGRGLPMVHNYVNLNFINHLGSIIEDTTFYRSNDDLYYFYTFSVGKKKMTRDEAIVFLSQVETALKKEIGEYFSIKII